jgi:hypothetical protein
VLTVCPLADSLNNERCSSGLHSLAHQNHNEPIAGQRVNRSSPMKCSVCSD